jgi:hypothetical protein
VTWSDEELRSIYQGRTARAAARAGCLEPEALVRVAANEASGPERLEAARHVADCSECASELLGARRALREVEGSGQAIVPRAGRGRPWLLAAAAVLAMILLPLFLWLPGDRVEDRTRGETSLDVTPAPESSLPSPPRELSWPAEPGASGYRVRLFDDRAEPLWESARIVEPRIQLPGEAIEAMAAAGAGAAFVWIVEVEGASYEDRLGPFWFRVGEDGGNRR